MTRTTELGLAAGLVRLANLVNRVFADVAREHGITPQQAQLLCKLIQGPVGMAELGRKLDLEKSSLTGLVDRAERRGLVRRVRDRRDRRACLIELTDDGTRIAFETHQVVCDELEKAAVEVPVADQERMTDVIARIAPDAPEQG
ncbi:MarR family winged helix-turn-helix transcriptional regulator [Saccharopolyspora phatthalungensis]|uniref:DNA-binding MarR family transcriptional regulator n=1 Tax=Saccharopolyspora phatthalungensis TaxID=664693 RepID=A0A840QIB4_9PSEU|nr:MarR family winged helix-turn-helix transcriptional regulator [Saccharopolyspora phatthalungensis]MBB5159840.1 DNA-binding MarR family transcriptional regulator [Saccharopolyspora phatthalungensis]